MENKSPFPWGSFCSSHWGLFSNFWANRAYFVPLLQPTDLLSALFFLPMFTAGCSSNSNAPQTLPEPQSQLPPLHNLLHPGGFISCSNLKYPISHGYFRSLPTRMYGLQACSLSLCRLQEQSLARTDAPQTPCWSCRDVLGGDGFTQMQVFFPGTDLPWIAASIPSFRSQVHDQYN